MTATGKRWQLRGRFPALVILSDPAQRWVVYRAPERRISAVRLQGGMGMAGRCSVPPIKAAPISGRRP